MGREREVVRFSARCQTPPQMVYELLADVRTHRVWGGEQQRGFFRLLSLEAPQGTVSVGAEFASHGNIPGSIRRFEDRSVVTEAVPGALFAFTTYSTVHHGRGKVMQAVYQHRYEIAPEGDGCRVTYTFRQVQASQPMLRLSVPLVRDMVWRVGIPFMMRRGFDNLLAMAEKSPRGR